MCGETTLPRHMSWRAKLGLVIFSVALTGGMLEAALRVNAALEMRQAARAAEGEYWAIYDPDLGYRQNPRWGDLNADGLRDHPIGPKNGRFRILFLGDSIAFYGDDVDDTFVGHLRSALRQAPGREQLDIINAGIKGFTNYQELLYLKKFGLKFEPDLVGVQFCLNDLHKFLHTFRVEDGRIVSGTYQFSEEVVNNTPQRPRPLGQRIVEASAVLQFVRDRVPIAARTLAWRTTDGFSFDYRIDIHSAWQDAPWEDIERQFGEMVEIGRRHRFSVFVVAVPQAAQYNAKYLARDRAYVLKPQRKLRDITERLGVPYLDLYPDLSAGLFVDDGIHLTKEGRRLTGRRIAAFLADARLLPAGGPGR